MQNATCDDLIKVKDTITPSGTSSLCTRLNDDGVDINFSASEKTIEDGQLFLRKIPTYEPPPSRTQVSVKAIDYVDSLNITTQGPPELGYGSDIILNGPEYNQKRKNMAEYSLWATASGLYDFIAEYAAGDPRGVVVTINGKQVMANALSATTGGFKVANQKSRIQQPPVRLKMGTNTVRLEREGPFPHIRTLTFSPH
jgi:hypothetical protein